MSSSSTNVSDIDRSRPMTREEKKVILASSAGTIFEWYDFYLYGSLSAIIGAKFFTAYPDATQNLYALLAFAAGFLVRPFGALVFGSIGDIVGRKYTFLMTITIMGLSTFLVGLLPGYETWGDAAPILLIALRMLQGLALGGEYGGAAVYVAEHSPHHRRGYYTSFIQTTATLGLFLSLVVILLVQAYTKSYPPVDIIKDGVAATEPYWNNRGWRWPFLFSAVLLAISLYIRLQMQESPQFQRIKAEGLTSKAPLRETFGQWVNAKWAIIALLGLTAGQAVVWYSGQFYARSFLLGTMKVDSFTTDVLVAWSLLIATPFFIFFGNLSDKIGRKAIILGGCALAAVTYFFVFGLIAKTANPALANAQNTAVVTVTADPATCHVQFNPTAAKNAFTSACDVAKDALQKQSVQYVGLDGAAGSNAEIKVGDVVIPSYDLAAANAAIKTAKDALTAAKAGTDQAAIDAAQKAFDDANAVKTGFAKSLAEALKGAGYPEAGMKKVKVVDGKNVDLAKDEVVPEGTKVIEVPKNPTVAAANGFFDIFTGQKLALLGLLTYLVLLVTMVYGPIAAALVELFPTRIRYSGLSLPYHIGNGWFGGFLPFIAVAIAISTGNPYSGLWYPIIVAVMTVIIGAIFVPNGTHTKDIFADDRLKK